MKSMYLQPLKAVREGGRVTRRCEIRREGASVENFKPSEVLWYEVDDHDSLPGDDDAEAFVTAYLLEAMREGRTLYVHGTVSRELLGNLQEFQEVWASWRPDLYQRIRVVVDQVDDAVNLSVPGALCAFSGGVDATFSVWRNTGGRNGFRTQSIALCALVHGFDIPLSEGAAFDKTFSSASATLKELGLPLRSVRTNYRELSRVRWEDSFAAALVAALQNYKGLAGVCLVGSSEPYDSLVIPWGSSPITDPLLGSSSFRVIHDGASHSRTRKVREVGAWRAGADRLRVCWEGDLKGQNCGRCEKCVRTMLNFSANALPIPACFPQQEVDLGVLQSVKLRNSVIRAEWQQIVDAARKLPAAPAWLPLVERKLLLSAARDTFNQALRSAKKFAKHLLKRVRGTGRFASTGGAQVDPV